MSKFLNSLSIKIGAIIILVEVIVLTGLGFIYVNRFSNQVDMQIETQAQLPGVLMNAGLLSFDSVSDPATMRDLVGDQLISGMVVGVNGNVFYALDPDLLGMDVAEIPDVDAGLFDINNLQNIVIQNPDRVIAVSPIYAADQSTPRFFVYTEVSNHGATAEKTALTNLFVFGSLATLLLTSLVIIISFNRMISKRISNLVGILKHVQAGDLTVRVQNPKSQDEIGFLQRGTNDMIEAREQSQAQIIHLNRVLRAIRNVNQLITQERDLDRLLERACEHLTEADSYASAWILLLNEDGTPSKFARRDNAGHKMSLTELLEQGEFMACAQDVMTQAGVQIINQGSDMCQDCFLLAICSGPNDVMAIRLEYDGKLYGVMNVSVLSEFVIDSEERSLFAEVAGDISFALYSMGLEEERKQAEAKLLKNQYYLTKAQEIGIIGTWELDIQKNILIWTDENYKIFGVPPGTEMNYELFLNCIHPDDRKYVQEEWGAALINEPYDIEHRVIVNDEVKWVREKAEVEFNTEGDPILAIGFTQDITNRKLAEEEIKKVVANLERSNAELAQFAYVASHDLQEPLRMISSYMQLLEQRYGGQLDDDADEFIAYAVDGAKRLHLLINSLLEYTRVDTRGKALVSTNCEEVLNRTLRNLGELIKESGASVTHDPLPILKADSIQLEQIFQNLIGNAIKFRSEAPPEIHIGAERANGEWLFSVRDNGIGIEPKYYERIFVIFQRLHSVDKYPGTGIGLAVCKRIIERHGGRMWVESEPGKGSTFFFSIPDGGEK